MPRILNTYGGGFMPAAIDLQRHCNIDRTARCNSTCHNRLNVPLAVLFWALMVLLARCNSLFFLQCASHHILTYIQAQHLPFIQHVHTKQTHNSNLHQVNKHSRQQVYHIHTASTKHLMFITINYVLHPIQMHVHVIIYDLLYCINA